MKPTRRVGRAYPSVRRMILLKKKLGADNRRVIILSNAKQSQEYSRGGDIEVILHAMVDRNGKVRVLYANENDGKRKLYLNYRDNDWNENCRFPSTRNFLLINGNAPVATAQELFV